jgi:hypothetical protein
VPVTKLEEVQTRLYEIKEEFENAADSFVSRFSQMVDAVREDPRYTEFYEKCLKNVYPRSPEDLRNKFHFKFVVFKIKGFEGFEETSIEDAVAQDKIIKEKEQELREQMKEEVGDFVSMYVNQMRSEVVKFCELVTARVNNRCYGDEEKPKSLTPNAISCFKDKIDHFRAMNIFEDKELQVKLQDLKEYFLDNINGVKSITDSAGTKQAITNAVESIHASAAAQGQEVDDYIGLLKRKVVI